MNTELAKTMVVVKLDPDLKMTGQGSFSMILSKQLYVSIIRVLAKFREKIDHH